MEESLPFHVFYSVPWSHSQVLQLQEVDHGELGHRHEVQSNDKVGHVGYQIDQLK